MVCCRWVTLWSTSAVMHFTHQQVCFEDLCSIRNAFCWTQCASCNCLAAFAGALSGNQVMILGCHLSVPMLLDQPHSAVAAELCQAVLMVLMVIEPTSHPVSAA